MEYVTGLLVFVAVVVFVGIVIMIRNFYRKVDQGTALIINGFKKIRVTFAGGVVFPIIDRAEYMDISVKTIDIDRRGQDGLICEDNIRADIKVTFFVRVNKTTDDVLKVAQAIGCERASHQSTLEALFSAKFSEALKTVGKQLQFIDLYTQREQFRDDIIRVIGTDLNGYALEDCAIDYLEQTPLDSLDQDNILDAQGIKKITELTTIEKINTNAYQNNERKRIRKQDVEADEAIFELDRQREEALAKQQREIRTVQAREDAEAKKVEAEEQLRAKTAEITRDQELGVQTENQQREIQVAEKNKQRVVLVETERVEKDRALEQVSREREVTLADIAKEKAVEVEKKEIADVIRERVAVERTVAEEEERIKGVRVIEEAKREKAAVVISAEAQAEEKLVKDIKAAEAGERASSHAAKEKVTLATAELEAADKIATAKIRLSEGVQAEEAAVGLAKVRVREADSTAIEKVGLAEVRVKEADADATQKYGTAEATVLREKGLAEADALGKKMEAEAGGLAEKAKAMAALDEASRDHEEYRIALDKDKAVDLAQIQAQKEIADAQARVLGEALTNANIDIIGGESLFVDKLVGAMAMGKSVDGFIGKSDAVQGAVAEYLDGERSLPQDLKDVLSDPAMSSGDVQNLTVAALLSKLMGGADAERKGKLGKLLEAAKSAGLDDMTLS